MEVIEWYCRVEKRTYAGSGNSPNLNRDNGSTCSLCPTMFKGVYHWRVRDVCSLPLASPYSGIVLPFRLCLMEAALPSDICITLNETSLPGICLPDNHSSRDRRKSIRGIFVPSEHESRRIHREGKPKGRVSASQRQRTLTAMITLMCQAMMIHTLDQVING